MEPIAEETVQLVPAAEVVDTKVLPTKATHTHITIFMSWERVIRETERGETNKRYVRVCMCERDEISCGTLYLFFFGFVFLFFT